MSVKNKVKQFIRKKNLNPMNNRKKVGIILFATSIGLFFLFAFRLSYIVGTGEVAGTSLKAKTEELYNGSTIEKARRGSILDRNGQVIAEDATSYSLYAVLNEGYVGIDNKKLYAQPKNFEAIAEVLEKHTDLSKEEVLQFLKDNKNEDGSDKYQVEFGAKGKNLSLEKKQLIEQELEEKEIEGVYFTDHPDRIYPNGVFASHFIGYADLANQDNESAGLTGMMGLEQTYDELLSGTDGKINYQQDVNGNPIPGTVEEETEVKNGDNIYTTLDIRLQTRLESLLDSAQETYKPEQMTTMLMKAKTGEIIAMSQRPSFEPETRAGLDQWLNLLVEDSFEPGSTMKIITSAAAIQEGVFHPDETFVYPVGGVVLDGSAGNETTVNDWDHGEKGPLTFRQAISWSSNVGMIELEKRMGNTKWQEYLRNFGFGQSTNSGLGVETSGTLPQDNTVDQAMSSFGQAISVTSFQMMQAFSAFANNGTMIKPRFVEKTVDSQTGEETYTQREELGTPVSAQAVNDVRTYMIDTVEDPIYGIAYEVYQVPGYRVAAKTGTAQIVENGMYLRGATDNIYSVVEMVPAEDPEYILYVTVKKPEHYVKTMLAEIANPLLKLAMDIDNTEGVQTVEPAVVEENQE